MPSIPRAQWSRQRSRKQRRTSTWGADMCRGVTFHSVTSATPLVEQLGDERHGKERRPPGAARIRPWRMLVWSVSRRCWGHVEMDMG